MNKAVSTDALILWLQSMQFVKKHDVFLNIWQKWPVHQDSGKMKSWVLLTTAIIIVREIIWLNYIIWEATCLLEHIHGCSRFKPIAHRMFEKPSKDFDGKSSLVHFGFSYSINWRYTT